MKIVETKNLCKNFKDKLAVNNVSINIAKNTIYSFLGLNGAGKTTTIKMLNGLIVPTSGDAIIKGNSLINNLNEIKKISSISPQESAISYKLTVYENIYMMAKIHSMKSEEAVSKTNELITLFKLDEFRNKYAYKLSGGYQRRLSIAMALVSNPQILYLDEPTLGLDVISRRELWELIKKLKQSMTIVLTTHYLEEVEALSDCIGIIKDGNMLFEGTLSELLAITQKDNIEDAFIKISGGEEY